MPGADSATRPSSAQRVGRGTALLVGVLDAALTLLVPVAVLVVVALLVWAVDAGARPGWTGYYSAAADLWFVGHGVDIAFRPPGVAPFTVTIAALGPALVTVLAGLRAGRRARRTVAPGGVVLVGTATVASLAALLLLTASRPIAAPDPVQAIALPAILYAAAALPGALLGRGALRPEGALADAVRLGLGAATAVVAAAALAVAVLLIGSLPAVVSLFESVHAGATGGLALTAVQLALLPTTVVWAVAFLVGPGFALGAGSSIGPLGTHLGPVPSLPILGALPTGSAPIDLAVVLVPIVAGFVVGVLTARRSERPLPGLRLLGIGLLGGLVGGALLALLAAAASGAMGPGRLAVAGPDALLVGCVAALEIAIPAVLGLVTGMRGRAATPGDVTWRMDQQP
ncbi:DUF6350 family protein [uncultured Amnibacterium sp.]|uniref:cell division protein PerM n=1 Tax=uncultured Amnibacterium sp. TaxID=1631851 RepID=UPI0035CBF657